MTARTQAHVAMATSMLMGVLLFQNCSGDGFQSQPNTGSNAINSGSANPASTGSGNTMAPITTVAAGMVLEDSTVGNGSTLTRLTQKVYNAKPGLKGCTGVIANYNSTCLKDSDYILITSAAAWGANAYNAAADVYSVDMDISTYNWPATTYFSRYIAADGSRREFIFTPGRELQAKPARLQWVYTNPQSCVGPTPAPAPIGESCSTEGDTRSNACGTATCQFK